MNSATVPAPATTTRRLNALADRADMPPYARAVITDRDRGNDRYMILTLALLSDGHSWLTPAGFFPTLDAVGDHIDELAASDIRSRILWASHTRLTLVDLHAADPVIELLYTDSRGLHRLSSTLRLKDASVHTVSTLVNQPGLYGI